MLLPQPVGPQTAHSWPGPTARRDTLSTKPAFALLLFMGLLVVLLLVLVVLLLALVPLVLLALGRSKSSILLPPFAAADETETKSRECAN